MTDVAVKTVALGKRYRIGQRKKYERLTENIWEAVRHPVARRRNRESSSQIWALRDVSLEIPRGEVAGIIGRNGAGKTTLLKILSRVTEPTEGYAELHGRVGSLLEVGTGFHYELTGRENIYLSGAIMGMRRVEIDRKFDDIVQFAEVDRFVDTPVKRYSSGMFVRLGFAVAAHLETEILMVDEVLAVGDAAFQKKCLGKMDEVAHQGRTVLFVSHNMAAVQNLCSHAYLLESGGIIASGDVAKVINGYLNSVSTWEPVDLGDRADRQGDGRLRFIKLNSNMRCGSPSAIKLYFRGEAQMRNVHISIGIFSLRGEGALYLSNDLTGDLLDELPSDGALVCKFDRLPLLAGSYRINVYCTVNGILADWVVDAARIDVSEGDYFGTGKLPPSEYGAVAVPHEWAVENA